MPRKNPPKHKYHGRNAAGVIRRHIQSHTDYSMLSLQNIASTYGAAMLRRVIRLLHRLNAAKGLTPRYFDAYTQWVKVGGKNG